MICLAKQQRYRMLKTMASMAVVFCFNTFQP